MSFTINWESLTTAERDNWSVTALALCMAEVRTTKQKREAQFRLRFMAKIYGGPGWYKARELELLRPGFWYTCNAPDTTRTQYVRKIADGIAREVDNSIDTELRIEMTRRETVGGLGVY